MTGAGFISTVFPRFILMWIRVGGSTTGNTTGMDIGGIMNGSPIVSFNGTGGAGIPIDIGKGMEELGESRVTSPDPMHRDGN
jgi:hypothetical protein